MIQTTSGELHRFKIRLGLVHFVVGIDFSRCLEFPLTLSRLNAREGMVILDVGCGSSVFPIFLAYKGCVVYAVDISKKEIGEAYQRTKKSLSHLLRRGRLNFGIHDAGRLPYPNNFFDRITCVSALEHVPQDKEVMKECGRVLKPGGIMVLTLPYGESYKEITLPKGERRYNDPAIRERLVGPSRLKIASLDYLGRKRSRFRDIWYKIPRISRFALGWSTTFTSKLFLGIVRDRRKAIGVCVGLEK